MMQTYKDLKVWQLNQLCILEFVKFGDKLPNSQVTHIITDQLLRSLLSVGANLAEGYSSYEGKEYQRYIKIALGSAVESDHWLSTLMNIFENSKGEIEKVRGSNVEVIKMLKGLMKSIANKRNSPPKPSTQRSIPCS